jgi:SPOR domain
MRGIIVASTLLAACVATGCSRREAAWQDARREDSVPAYEAYLAKFPSGAHAAEARAALDGARETEAWSRAMRLGTPEAWQRYLAGWPDGRYAALARRLLVDFIPPAPPVPASAGTPAAFDVQLGAWLDESMARAALAGWLGPRKAALEGVAPRLDAPPAGGPALWRLRAGPLDERAARALCGRLKASGVDCVPVAASAGDAPP